MKLRGVVWLVALTTACPLHALAATPSNWPAIAQRIVARLGLQTGELVLPVTGPETPRALVDQIRQAVAQAGGVGLPSRPSSAQIDDAFLNTVDVSIMLPGAAPGQPLYAAIQDKLREGKGRNVHFHWTSLGSAVALGDASPADSTVVRTYTQAVLDIDYDALGDALQRFEQALRSGPVQVTTPAGTDVSFRVGQRPVCRQDGDASPARMKRARTLIDREVEFPAGAMRVAPIESSVEGTIAFRDGDWDGRPARGVKLRFVKGRVVEVTAASGRDAVLAELERGGDAAHQLREFVVGFNPALAVPASHDWVPYYGYGAGVVRLSLGNNEELGGDVRGPYVRIDLSTDATVVAGGRPWVKGGRLATTKAQSLK